MLFAFNFLIADFKPNPADPELSARKIDSGPGKIRQYFEHHQRQNRQGLFYVDNEAKQNYS